MLVSCHPRLIVLFHKLAERGVCLVLLHHQQLVHVRFRLCQLHFPENEFLVQFIPVLDGVRLVDLFRDAAEFLLIVGSGLLRHQRTGMQVLFERHENLVRIDRLDKIVGNLVADSLVHDVFLLALRNHNHRHIGMQLLDLRQRL